jgi:hypothetical protein
MCRGRGKSETSSGGERGYRAEVRRERKKRDIPSPVNELYLINYIKKHFTNQYYFFKKLIFSL